MPSEFHLIHRDHIRRRIGLRRLGALLVAGLIVLFQGTPASYAQDRPETVSVIPPADSLFRLGLERFDEGHFAEAHTLFQRAVDNFDLHAGTTAAMLMAGKSSYRLGDYPAARDELEALVEAFPSSGYLEEARRTIGFAVGMIDREVPDTVRVGIVLSLSGEEATVSQSLFNGVRLAVEDYNLAGRTAPVKMVFRDSGGQASGAADAVRRLADEDVDFIVGTVFSDQAIAAAEAAERERIVFVAPLATDERVSEGKRYAFQANPTIELRGRLMARFAVNGLRLNAFGVIAMHEADGVSERLTDAFIKEASELGASINLVRLLPDENAWIRLSETVSRDTLSHVEAIYVPVTSPEPLAVIGALLSSLDRMRASVRILGNSAWHQLPMVSAASRYTATYSNDFYLAASDPSLTIFQARFRELSGESPNRPAYAGYDVTKFMLQIVSRRPEEPLYESVWFEPEYRGIASRIGFFGLNVNGALFFHRYRDGELRLIR